jgi:hypothetical protein
MRALIDAETAGESYETPAAAQNIVRKLRVTDTDLLSGWLDSQADHFVWQAINDRDRSTRSRARQQARRTAFADAAETFQSGGKQAMTSFLSMPFALEDGTRKRLADMDAADLTFAANQYEIAEHEAAMNKAFLKAIAKKVGKDKVSDHFTEQQLATMWSSLSK